MRYASIRDGGRTGIAASENDRPFRVLYEGDASYPGTLDSLVGSHRLEHAFAAFANAPTIDIEAVEFLPPLQGSGRIICIGLNYHDHATETGHAVPTYPVVFGRFASSLIGHGTPIVRPHASRFLDFEGEFVAVIGKAGRDIPEDRALEHVVAYALFNDASVRDFQRKSDQWTIGKNFDGTGAFGPYLVSAASLPEGCGGLELTTYLNGEQMQRALTDDLIFSVARLVSLMSVPFELQPGDLIVTGTPAGIGALRKPPVFMKPGDICEIAMGPLGTLRNSVADQPKATERL